MDSDQPKFAEPSGGSDSGSGGIPPATEGASGDPLATVVQTIEDEPAGKEPVEVEEGTGGTGRRRGSRKSRPSLLTRLIPNKRIRSLVEWVVVIAIALVVALGIRQYVFQPFWIPSGSMEDTLSVGDRVLVNKASYRFHGVRRGDVVVFEQPESWPLAENVKDLIKRVIAIPGDEVFITECAVWLNGQKLIEPYVDGKCTEPAESVVDPDGDGRFVVPEKMLFVMGDNRTGSTDSRYNGFVPESDVVGRAFVVIWPAGNWRWL